MCMTPPKRSFSNSHPFWDAPFICHIFKLLLFMENCGDFLGAFLCYLYYFCIQLYLFTFSWGGPVCDISTVLFLTGAFGVKYWILTFIGLFFGQILYFLTSCIDRVYKMHFVSAVSTSTSVLIFFLTNISSCREYFSKCSENLFFFTFCQIHMQCCSCKT